MMRALPSGFRFLAIFELFALPALAQKTSPEPVLIADPKAQNAEESSTTSSAVTPSSLTLNQYIREVLVESNSFRKYREDLRLAELRSRLNLYDYSLTFNANSAYKKSDVFGSRAADAEFSAHQFSLTQSFPYGVGLTLGYDANLALPKGDSSGNLQSWSAALSEDLYPNFLGRQRNLLRKRDALMSKAEKLSAESSLLDRCEKLINEFGDLYLHQERLRLESEQLKTATTLETWAKRAYRERRRTESDWNNARQNLLLIESRLAEHEEERQKLLKSLQAEIASPFQIAADPQYDLQGYVAEIENKGPGKPKSREAEALSARAKAAAENAKIVDSENGLNLALYGAIEENRGRGELAALDSPGRAWSVGLKLSLPLWDRTRDNAVATAKSERMRAEYAAREVEIEKTVEIEQLLFRKQRLDSEVRRQEEIVALTNKNEKEARRKLQIGQIDFPTYGLQWSERNQAEQRWLLSRGERLRTVVAVLKEGRFLDDLCMSVPEQPEKPRESRKEKTETVNPPSTMDRKKEIVPGSSTLN